MRTGVRRSTYPFTMIGAPSHTAAPCSFKPEKVSIDIAHDRADGARRHRSLGSDQPGCPVGDAQQRQARPRSPRSAGTGPGVLKPGRCGIQADEHRLAAGIDAQAASTGLAAALAWCLRWLASRNT